MVCDSTAHLRRNLDKDDNKNYHHQPIQKLNNLIKGEANLPIYNEQVVFILTNATTASLVRRRRISKENLNAITGLALRRIFPAEMHWERKPPASVFGRELHRYVNYDAIVIKVLKI